MYSRSVTYFLFSGKVAVRFKPTFRYASRATDWKSLPEVRSGIHALCIYDAAGFILGSWPKIALNMSDFQSLI